MYIILNPDDLQPDLQGLARRAVAAIAEVSGLEPDEYGGIDAEAELYDSDRAAVRATLDIVDVLIEDRPLPASLREVLLEAIGRLK